MFKAPGRLARANSAAMPEFPNSAAMLECPAVERQSSLLAKVFCAESAAVFAIYFYGLLMPSALYESRPPTGIVINTVLLAYGCFYMVRLNMMAPGFLPQKTAKKERSRAKLVWIPCILATFAVPAVASPMDFGLGSFALSLIVYVAGFFLNTWSEWEKKVLKTKPGNRGSLFLFVLTSS